MIDARKEIYDFRRRLQIAGLDLQGLIEAFLENNPLDWRVRAEIIPDYMPPYPRPETRSAVVVKYGAWFLRYSQGPRQGFSWDFYGDDLKTVGLAFKALLEAPCPAHLWVVEVHRQANAGDQDGHPITKPTNGTQQ